MEAKGTCVAGADSHTGSRGVIPVADEAGRDADRRVIEPERPQAALQSAKSGAIISGICCICARRSALPDLRVSIV